MTLDRPEQFKNETHKNTNEEVRLFEQKFQRAVQAEQDRASRETILALIHDAWVVAQDITDEGERNGALDACDRLQERIVEPKPKSKADGGEQDFHAQFDAVKHIPPKQETK